MPSGRSFAACRQALAVVLIVSVTVAVPAASRTAPQSDFGSLLMDSHSFYRTQWVGHLPRDFPIKWRHDAFVQEVGPTRLNWGDLTGGLMEGREAGTVKITPTIAWTTSMLAWGMLEFGSGYNLSGPSAWQTGLQTLRWNTDYLLKTFKLDAQSSAVSEAPEFFIVYQVGNATIEKSTWTRPENETTARPAYYVTTYNGALASSAIIFQPSDPTYSSKLLDVATDLFFAGERSRATYTHGLNYPCSDVDQGLAMVSEEPSGIDLGLPTCLPGDELFEGALVATFNSTSFLDDLAWSSLWMYRATKNETYLGRAFKYYNALLTSDTFDERSLLSDWDSLFWPVTLLMADTDPQPKFAAELEAYFEAWMCGMSPINRTDLGRSVNTLDPTLGQTMNAAFLALLYGQTLTSKNATNETNADAAQQYTCWAQSQADFILSNNTGSYVVGYGGAPTHIHERASSCPVNESLPCNALNALYTTEPNPSVLTGALVYGPGLEDIGFVDDRSNSEDTYVSIENNAGLTGVMAGLQQLVAGHTAESELFLTCPEVPLC